MGLEKKIQINCEEFQYFQEEQTDSDYEDDIDPIVNTKQKNSSTDITQLQKSLNQQIKLVNGGTPSVDSTL
jgi:hypothetical protein